MFSDLNIEMLCLLYNLMVLGIIISKVIVTKQLFHLKHLGQNLKKNEIGRTDL